MSDKPSFGRAGVRAILADARPVAPAPGGPPAGTGRGKPRPGGSGGTSPPPPDDDRFDDEGGEGAGPPGQDEAGIDMAAVERCALLDQSDAGNGERLRNHFGQDLLVQKTEGVASADWIVWDGRHWDAASGQDAVERVAQKIGARIALEATFLAHTPREQVVLRDVKRVLNKDEKKWTDQDRALVAEAERAPTALANRRRARLYFGTSSRNSGRLANMKKCAAPYLTREPDAFNADPHLVAVEGHTLRFAREVLTVSEPDPECPDPDVVRHVERKEVRVGVEAIEGHRREHLITKLAPVRYDPAATCPKWVAFLEECLPNPNIRGCVQVFSGLGLTGVALQKVMFHWGAGANGKSVFLETLMRLLGPLGVGLPAASLVGENTATGSQANPDIARLYGARIVRVAELPANQPLKEELVKLLTGGERMPVRNLFKGFFEFTPVFKAHMSGNGYPRIDGTDNGIWRRMTVIHWPVIIPEERRRELDEIVSEFIREEGPGILNWLVDGVLTFLREGFVVPPEVQAATQDYRNEMDPIGMFVSECVRPRPGGRVQAREMYTAYQSWSAVNAKTAVSETKFGRVLKGRFAKDEKSNRHAYLECELFEVPNDPATEGSWTGRS